MTQGSTIVKDKASMAVHKAQAVGNAPSGGVAGCGIPPGVCAARSRQQSSIFAGLATWAPNRGAAAHPGGRPQGMDTGITAHALRASHPAQHPLLGLRWAAHCRHGQPAGGAWTVARGPRQGLGPGPPRPPEEALRPGCPALALAVARHRGPGHWQQWRRPWPRGFPCQRPPWPPAAVACQCCHPRG